MPLKKEKFSIVQDNMTESIDIDDSRGRSVPINMNFIETGYLTKDTGFSLLGATETSLPHSPYYYQKKDGTNYHIRILGTSSIIIRLKFLFGYKHTCSNFYKCNFPD